MRCVRLAYAVLMLCASAALPGSAEASLLISIDKSTQRMAVVVDGRQIYSWPVSTGRAGYATPAGSYKPFRLEEDHYSKEWDEAPMPHSIFFTRTGHAIHGSFDVRRLGAPASHGCVRLAPANAARLFALVREEGLDQTRIVLGGDERVRQRPPREEVAAYPARARRVRIADEFGADPSVAFDADRFSGEAFRDRAPPTGWR